MRPTACADCGQWACVASRYGWFCIHCWYQLMNLMRLGVER